MIFTMGVGGGGVVCINTIWISSSLKYDTVRRVNNLYFSLCKDPHRLQKNALHYGIVKLIKLHPQMVTLLLKFC